MVAPKPLDGDFFVAGQIAPDDLGGLAAAGFRTIICNRPDGEVPGQPDAATLDAEAKRLGLAFHFLPVSGADVRESHADALGEILSSKPPGAVLAFCRTGTRSAMVWALREARMRPAEDVLAKTRDAGYELGAFLGAAG
ncbi:TIGR01244 family phosphatase [Oceanicola sp. D3]|uniref:TIGR01244 family sulfur transferase n=1 Tax=Oceanicola sp. D3 TaxID=2587163 RepID=UPI001120D5F3|nr:TIGR01244 family sulfur transferase [Oceanicola sp. D3]QDC11370.1 TIGR01244 family phosphatase [Oceanicola sp. D3]